MPNHNSSTTAIYNRKNIFLQSFDFLENWFCKKEVLDTTNGGTTEEWVKYGSPDLPLLVSCSCFFTGLVPYRAQLGGQWILHQDIYLLFINSPTLKYTQKIVVDVGGDYTEDKLNKLLALRRKRNGAGGKNGDESSSSSSSTPLPSDGKDIIHAARDKAFQVANSLSRLTYVQNLKCWYAEYEDVRSTVLEQVSKLRHLESFDWTANKGKQISPFNTYSTSYQSSAYRDAIYNTFPHTHFHTPEKISNIFALTPLVQLELQLGSDTESVFQPLISSVARTLKNLSLRPSSLKDGAVSGDAIFPIIGEHLPRLKSLILFNVCINSEDTLKPMLKLNQLKQLSLVSITDSFTDIHFTNRNNNNNNNNARSRTTVDENHIARSFHHFTKSSCEVLEELTVRSMNLQGSQLVGCLAVLGIVSNNNNNNNSDSDSRPSSSSPSSAFQFPSLQTLDMDMSCTNKYIEPDERELERRSILASIVGSATHFPNLSKLNLRGGSSSPTRNEFFPVKGRISVTHDFDAAGSSSSSSSSSSFQFVDLPFLSQSESPMFLKKLGSLLPLNLVSVTKTNSSVLTAAQGEELLKQPPQTTPPEIFTEVSDHAAASLMSLLLVENNGEDLCTSKNSNNSHLEELILPHIVIQHSPAVYLSAEAAFTSGAVQLLKSNSNFSKRQFCPKLKTIEIKSRISNAFLEFLCGGGGGGGDHASSLVKTLKILRLRPQSHVSSFVTAFRNNNNNNNNDNHPSASVTDEGIAHIANLINLEELDLSSFTAISDQGVAKVVSKLHWLQDLSLNGCSLVGDETCAAMKDLYSLYTVSLENTSITGATFKCWKKLANLSCLFLADCEDFVNEEYFAVFDSLNVGYIDLYGTDLGPTDKSQTEEEELFKRINEQIVPNAVKRGLYIGH